MLPKSFFLSRISMGLTYRKAEAVSLKGHVDFSEKWLQQRIIDDPSILGLGDVELVAAEKIQPKAGRLDLLLHDEQLNRRYEVELMLGPTNPSHIMRCIEYWDIERRRYPSYDHVAVLVAEDVTSRFLNLMSLLSGSIPLIAVQLKALVVDDKIVLHFARVLDQTELRTDDEYELGESGSGSSEKNRAWWQQQVPPEILGLADELTKFASAVAGKPHEMQYLKKVVNLVSNGLGESVVWFHPRKTVLNLGAYVPDIELWLKRFADAGLAASLRRGGKAVLVTLSPATFPQHVALLTEFLKAAYFEESSENL